MYLIVWMRVFGAAILTIKNYKKDIRSLVIKALGKSKGIQGIRVILMPIIITSREEF